MSGWKEHVTADVVVKVCVREVDEGVRQIRSGVQDVELRSVALSSQSTQVFCGALVGSRVVRLRLSDCATGDSVVAALGTFLCSAGCALRDLDLSTNNIKHLCSSFLNAVRASHTLRGLNLSMNPITRTSLAQLSEAVALSSLHDVDLSSTGALYSAKEISVAAVTCPTLHTLRLGYNTCWFEDDARLFAKGLQSSAGSLTSLDLSSSAVGLAQCGSLADVIGNVRSLRHLCLRHNDICHKGVAALCVGLSNPDTNLHTLNLSSNSITGVLIEPKLFPCGTQRKAGCEHRGQYTDNGLVALTLALESNRSLRELDVSSCNLGLGTKSFYDGADHGGVALLCDSVKRNVTMRSVHLANNSFNPSTLRRLKRVAGGKAGFTAAQTTSITLSPSSSVDYGDYAGNTPL